MTKTTLPAGPVDLSEFDEMVSRQEQGILVPIHKPLPNGKSAPLGFSIRIAGPDSTRAQEALDEIQMDMIAAESLDVSTPTSVADRRIAYFAKVTLDFVPDEREDGTKPDHAMILDGAPLPYSEANAAKLYTRFRFILQQVQSRADTRAAFLNG